MEIRINEVIYICISKERDVVREGVCHGRGAKWTIEIFKSLLPFLETTCSCHFYVCHIEQDSLPSSIYTHILSLIVFSNFLRFIRIGQFIFGPTHSSSFKFPSFTSNTHPSNFVHIHTLTMLAFYVHDIYIYIYGF